MKLYNIYESIILEQENILLTENKLQDIHDAINGKYEVWFKYRDENGNVTDRYVQIYKLGTSRKNNDMISAYQKGGKTAKSKEDSKNYGWKQFLVNNIIDGSIKPVNMKFNKPVSDLPSYSGPNYNPDGKSGPNRQFNNVNNKVEFK